MQSVLITTKVVSSNLANGEDLLDTSLWLVADRWFSSGSPVSSTNKTDRHDIAEILSNMALNSIILTLTYTFDGLLHIWDTKNIQLHPFGQELLKINYHVMEKQSYIYMDNN